MKCNLVVTSLLISITFTLTACNNKHAESDINPNTGMANPTNTKLLSDDEIQKKLRKK
jgi:hypothetical protein